MKWTVKQATRLSNYYRRLLFLASSQAACQRPLIPILFRSLPHTEATTAKDALNGTKESKIEEPKYPPPPPPVPPFKPFHNHTYDTPRISTSVTVEDILSNPEIESSYLFTYYMSLNPILSHFHSPNTNINVFVQKNHLSRAVDLDRSYPNLSVVEVNMQPFTSHHCKMILNKYNNGQWKIFLISCNLMPAELVSNNQICWESPYLPPLSEEEEQGRVPTVEGKTRFKQSLLGFLKVYQTHTEGNILDPLIQQLGKVDFSSIRGDFVSSVTQRSSWSGTDHPGFGLKGLVNSLTAQGLIKERDIDIIYQSSSIAGPTKHETKHNNVSNIFTHLILPYITTARSPQCILTGKQALQEYLSSRNMTLRLIYPTIENIRRSKILGSGAWSIFKGHGTDKAESQLYMLRPYFYKPYSTQREYNTSHTKFLMVSSDGFQTIDWCLFTTCNISKQAWGSILKVRRPENFDLANFETGVLISKLDYEGYKLIPVGIGEIENGTRQLKEDEIPVVLPFDLDKCRKYEDQDEPWCIR